MAYGIYSAPGSASSNLTSTGSFDFAYLLSEDEPQLLSESLTLESLSSIASDDVIPPFPSRPIPPMSPLLFENHSPLLPLRSRTSSEEDITITLSTPTSPRLTRLLSEPLCVGRWVQTTFTAGVPGHIPWENVEHTETGPWIPTGSLYSPHDFNEALRSARINRSIKDGFYSPGAFGSLSSTLNAQSPSSIRRNSPSKALVFEREITIDADGEAKRWSVQASADTMNPEMVDMMLQLQGLNSYFKDSLEDSGQSTPVRRQRHERPNLPSLMVSNSQCALPLSTESPGPSMTLAARRGKNMLPPLTLNRSTLGTAYPTIPTAFLGSPSAYSPQFEHANGQDDPSLDLEDMVNSLRSRCAYPQPATPTDIEIVVDSPCSAMSFAPASDHEDDDDWAFAVSLLDEYGSQPAELNLGALNGVDQRSNSEPDLPSQREISTTPGGHSESSALSTPRITVETESNAPTPVPSTPLPSTPRNRSMSSAGVRGILKSSKNVRFASLPEKASPKKHHEKKGIDSPPINTPPPPPGLSATASLRRPSRVRSNLNYTRTANNATESTPTPVTPRTRTSASHAARNATADVLKGARSAPVSPSSPMDHLQTKKAVLGPHSRSPPRPTVRHSAPPRKSIPMSLGRQSFGRVAKEVTDENKGRTSLTPRPPIASRWTMNDMTFRRGSNASHHTPDSTKSRMPVPLRNILTRFK
ncbi:hypothetical protein Hypma_009131 [Hypsizygus marmoreus]|uniref:Uncharacterized protein n=1 Tax=Hypsizygus marmoreus TaxID=39966 RepID=A0A369JQU1_HYPMA|nr:hypothetical protein Hypma_009131 [Hypsizygus marmoreus]